MYRTLILVGCLLVSVWAPAMAQDGDAPPPLRVRPADARLAEVVGDAWAGQTSAETFLSNQALASQRELESLGQTAAPDQQDFSLEVNYEEDPLLGCWSEGHYGFRGRVLSEFVVNWAGDAEVSPLRRETFFEALVLRHGPDFRRDVLVAGPGRHLPVLLWEGDAYTYLASTADPGQASDVAATYTYAAFPKGDPFLQKAAAGESLTEEERTAAFRSIETVLARGVAAARKAQEGQPEGEGG